MAAFRALPPIPGSAVPGDVWHSEPLPDFDTPGVRDHWAALPGPGAVKVLAVQQPETLQTAPRPTASVHRWRQATS